MCSELCLPISALYTELTGLTGAKPQGEVPGEDMARHVDVELVDVDNIFEIELVPFVIGN